MYMLIRDRGRVKMAALLCIAILCTALSSSAQKKSNREDTTIGSPASQALYDTIARMDSILFHAFNNRDLETVKTVFSKEVEFYHDQGGLAHYDQVIENTRRLFEQNNGLIRTLLPGSLEVYPLRDYGAIQVGRHRFCHQENGKEDCGTFKFVHIWQRTGEGWKLARVISYDH